MTIELTPGVKGGRDSEKDDAEAVLFTSLGIEGLPDAPSVFIVGGVRTGSTLLYQLLAHHWPLSYVSNFTNTFFPNAPALGFAVEKATGIAAPASYHSAYGKIEGWWAPSEASYVFRHWYGGEQPSQTMSARVLPERAQHMDRTLEAVWRLTKRPLLTKNAWNCFRIEDIASRYTNAIFLWIRRDIAAAAISDLEARYRWGSPDLWNSATPANVDSIRRLPYWEQVVEQQYEYSRAISTGLDACANGRWIDIWYERLCADPMTECDRLDDFFTKRGLPRRGSNPATDAVATKPSRLTQEDRDRVLQYVAEQSAARLGFLRFGEGTEVTGG